MYNLFYYSMIVGYSGLVFLLPDIKSKMVGFLLLLVNGIIFYK